MPTIVMLHRLLAALLLATLTACGSRSVAPVPTFFAPTATDSAAPLTPSASPAGSARVASCPLTEPQWVKPAEDAAVQDPPAFGYYYVNQDGSIWASAWWPREEHSLQVGEEGNKMGWFRPAGAELEITGRRVDGQAPPLEAEVPCCYPTRFQATGVYFPTEGCWEITARAAKSELKFYVWVEPR
jgi:hypothetical protein